MKFTILSAVLAAVPKSVWDKLIDLAEQAVQDTNNPYDDVVAVPILKAVRIILEIPD